MYGFRFQNYGTFTGPAGFYDYDASEPIWHTLRPEDVSFKLNDLSMILFNNEANYVGFYCAGTSTQLMTLAHSTGNIPSLRIQASNTIVNGNALINGSIVANGSLFLNGVVTLAGVGNLATQVNLGISSPAKPFDIPHPTKKDYRLRHTSLEGPEIAVYYRGKLENANVIELPEYWSGLVNAETISVNLTPLGVYQELFVEKIEWGKNIIVKNREGGAINCYYTVYAERKDMEKLIVEYEGQSIKDYPGQDWLNMRDN
jgi:hypothetical protein